MASTKKNLAQFNCRNFQDLFMSNISEILHANHFVDVTIYAEGKMIEAHKLVLAASSSHFYDMFRKMERNERTTGDVKYEDLISLIQYIYTGHVNVHISAMERFLETARKLHVNGLCEFDSGQIVAEPLPPKQRQQQQQQQQQPNTPAQSETNNDSLVAYISSDESKNSGVNAQHNNNEQPKTNLNQLQAVKSTKKRARSRQNDDRRSNAVTTNAKHFKSDPSTEVNRGIQPEAKFFDGDSLSVIVGQSASHMELPSFEKNSTQFLTSTKVIDTINSTNEQPEAISIPKLPLAATNADIEFVCNKPGCNRTFESSVYLRRHQLYKCGQLKEHKCHNCKKSFYHRGGLLFHWKTVPGCKESGDSTTMQSE